MTALVLAWVLAAGPAVPAGPADDADQVIELDIDERVIEQRDFEAAQAVRIDERGLELGAGVRLRADTLRVILRGVRGRVRFKATLEPLLSVLQRPSTQGGHR